ncbi:MAG: HEAT repeat domain-containing protein [Ruminococcaceae bacterium]|nr:HEAT repeat domain-containing protein [Oscillospiraceae bacterium]
MGDWEPAWFNSRLVFAYIIAFLIFILVCFVVVLIYIRVSAAIRDNFKYKLKQQIYYALSQATDRPGGKAAISIPGGEKVFGRDRLFILAEVFDEIDDQYKPALRGIVLKMGFREYINKQFGTNDMEYLILIIRMIGDLELVGMDSRVASLMYTHRGDINLQYQAYLTLAILGSQDHIVHICMDENYVQTLSFRSLQEVLKAYTGDKEELYDILLASPDPFVVRICIKRIGAEGVARLADKVFPYLGNGNFNIVIDAARTLGQLKYQPAAEKLVALLKNDRWEVRSIAVSALAAIDPADYEAPIAEALRDKEWQVRYNAALALSRSPNMDALLEKVKATGDRYAYEALEYVAQANNIFGKAGSAS